MDTTRIDSVFFCHNRHCYLLYFFLDFWMWKSEVPFKLMYYYVRLYGRRVSWNAAFAQSPSSSLSIVKQSVISGNKC